MFFSPTENPQLFNTILSLPSFFFFFSLLPSIFSLYSETHECTLNVNLKMIKCLTNPQYLDSHRFQNQSPKAYLQQIYSCQQAQHFHHQSHQNLCEVPGSPLQPANSKITKNAEERIFVHKRKYHQHLRMQYH